MVGENFAVKIYTCALQYDYQTPWKAPTISRWTGSGFVIDGKRIITNAHVAGGAVFLEVQLANDSVKYPATLKAVSHECDLAELTVDNEEFWQKTAALPIGETPQRKQKVEVHGFPIGGEGYCITDGIVSRLENDMYVHGEQILLSTQVSAPINPGNSGGAVLSEGKVVGVVHQGINRSQSIGYMIPASVLKHFIEQVRTNNMGFPTLGIECQNMENPFLREQYQMDKTQTGILVRDIPDLSCVKGKLQEGDVILKINGIQIWNDGTVHLDPMKHIDYRYLINNSLLGSEVEFEILRDGKKLVEKATLTNSLGSMQVIAPLSFGKPPTYFIIGGGIVVQPVSKNFVNDTQKSYGNKQKGKPHEQLVAINTILKSEYTQGYDDFNGELIAKVNDKEIMHIRDVIDAIQNNQGKFHKIQTQSGKMIVLPRLSTKLRQDLLKAYQINSDRSSDLSQYAKSEPQLPAIASSSQPILFSKASQRKPRKYRHTKSVHNVDQHLVAELTDSLSRVRIQGKHL
ncbi:MAG: trypsin-like peptidase domain-containing protein [Proteobacteria bacterium]|nr:trypsin-like peptidase domain-containing protein [Pseudomonadota bacterium]